MMDIEITSSILEALFILYFFYDFVIRGGRIRRFLWKLALYVVLLLPGLAVMNLEFTSQVQVDVSMSVLASTFVSASIWIIMFDPDISRTLTLVQFGTLVLSVAMSMLILLGVRENGSWEEKWTHLARIPGIVGAFIIRLPWDGPYIVRGLCWTIIWFIVSHNHEADDYYPSKHLNWLNRTVEINGTVLALG